MGLTKAYNATRIVYCVGSRAVATIWHNSESEYFLVPSVRNATSVGRWVVLWLVLVSMYTVCISRLDSLSFTLPASVPRL